MNGEIVVGEDIDGVLGGWSEAALPYINEESGFSLRFEDQHSHLLHEVYGITEDEMKRIMKKVDQRFDIGNIPVIAGALESMVYMMEAGISVPLITSRHERYHARTYDWCKQLPETPIYFSEGANNPYGSTSCGKTKLSVCRKLKAVAMIEDNLAELVTFVGTGIEPICHAQPWNENWKDHFPVGYHLSRGVWPDLAEYVIAKYIKHYANV